MKSLIKALDKAIGKMQEEVLLTQSETLEAALALVVSAKERLGAPVIKIANADRVKVASEMRAMISLGTSELPPEELAIIWVEVLKSLDRVQQSKSKIEEKRAA